MSELPPIFFEGEPVSDRDINLAMNGFEHDCKELAGDFYEKNRSEKFRIDWPDQDRFVASEWHAAEQDVHDAYTKLLGMPNVPEDYKKNIYIVIIRRAQIQQQNERRGIENNTRLQLRRDSQQFVGDKIENRKIIEKFGKRPTLRAALRNSTAIRH